MKRVILIILVAMAALFYIPASASSLNPRKTLVAFCSNLSTQSSAVMGVPTNITFSCGANPAFSATQATTSVPIYSLPQGYVALFLTGNTTLKLSSGISTSLTQGNYTYLAQYDGSQIGALSSFSITWSNR